MLRKIRTAVAIVVIAILTFGFLDFSGILNDPWLQKIQFGPALLSLSIVTLVCLIAATLIFGRLYCSVVCPLGIFQDFMNWLSKKVDKKKKYFYKTENPWLRWGVLAALIIAWLLGFTFLVSLVEPYSAYGRMADELFKPVYFFGNNLIAAISEKTGSYRFVKELILLKSVTALVVALLTLLIIGHFSYHHGRTWCNTICPVGTILGFFSRFSLLRMRIDKDKCNHCLACQRKCKAYCIDSVDQKIDYSRCVDCFDCIDACRQKAISYGPVKLEGGLTIPETTQELCVGCGGCEYICPVKAVHIEGNPVHLEAKAPEQDTNIKTDNFDFGF